MKKSKVVKILNSSNNPIPKYETAQSAGLDIRAKLEKPVTIHPKEYEFIPTGIAIELPEGLEAQVRSRSGLAFKHGIALLNGIGTIDSDYRGEIGVILMNYSHKPFTIHPSDRIAQLVINEVVRIDFESVKILANTVRGTGGYGSTGMQ